MDRLDEMLQTYQFVNDLVRRLRKLPCYAAWQETNVRVHIDDNKGIAMVQHVQAPSVDRTIDAQEIHKTLAAWHNFLVIDLISPESNARRKLGPIDFIADF